MKIALGSDEKTELTEFVAAELRGMGIEVELMGPPAGEAVEWAEVGEKVAERVADGQCNQGVLFCWTGTGVAMAANKVPGVRAALCTDSETARGARKWNDANVLVMSLRLTSPTIAKEILEAWFSTEPEPSEAHNVERVKETERKYLRQPNREADV